MTELIKSDSLGADALEQYRRKYREFRWETPEYFNFAATIDKFAEDPHRVAILWEDSEGRRARLTFAASDALHQNALGLVDQNCHLARASNQFVEFLNIELQIESFDSGESGLDRTRQQLRVFGSELLAWQCHKRCVRAIHDQSTGL